MIKNLKGTSIDCSDTVLEYISKEDWRIKANANTGYSNAGLINNISGKIIANFWLDDIYSTEEGKAHRNADYYIHDLDCLALYCSGWSLRQVLDEGFNGVTGRVSSKPPKHFREALGQMANFLGILQAEWAGAQAFSSFDTYLAPYVFHDQLSYLEVKKAITQFIFNLNVPARWGQCIPETTEILTEKGFKTLSELRVGENIYTLNSDGEYEFKKINQLQKYSYDGVLHRYYGRDYSQTVSPNHRVMHKKNNSDEVLYTESKDLFNTKTPTTFPVAGINTQSDYKISDEELEFIVFILTEGCIYSTEGKKPHLDLYKSPRRWGNERIKELAEKLNLKYSILVKTSPFGHPCNRYCFSSLDTESILKTIGNTKKELPDFFKKLSKRQAVLVINTWKKLDGYDKRDRLQCDTLEIASLLQEVALLAGHGSVIKERVIGNNKKPTIYLCVYKRPFKDGRKKQEVVYKGTVWCPNTDNGNMICREEGRVFITGNSPFTNITLDIKVPDDLKDKPPTKSQEHLFKGIENAELLAQAQSRGTDINSLEDMTYKHFSKEMDMINIAYYEVMTKGDATGQPFTFPIPTVNITEDFDWDSPVAKAIFENTTKVGSSYFQNFVGSQWKLNEDGNRVRNPEAYEPGAVRSMCCRLQLDLRELLKRGGGLFGSAEMTGSIGVVTLNMARLGYRFKGDEKALFEALDSLMDLAQSTLEKKRHFVQNMYDRGLYPYTSRYLHSLRNHFSTIGINGMNEMIRNFFNDEIDLSDEKGVEFSLRILEHMRNKMRDYQQMTGNLYNLEATPAEGATYRLAKKDKEFYPDILQAGSGENIYYTNSSQLPAGHTDDPFEALELQNELQCKYTGGTVLHLYMNEQLSSPEACKRFVKKVIENYQMPYITVTPVFSVCETHGYLKGEQPECPRCGEETNVWTRVMGYFRPVKSFNLGKKGEHLERKHFLEQ